MKAEDNICNVQHAENPLKITLRPLSLQSYFLDSSISWIQRVQCNNYVKFMFAMQGGTPTFQSKLLQA